MKKNTCLFFYSLLIFLSVPIFSYENPENIDTKKELFKNKMKKFREKNPVNMVEEIKDQNNNHSNSNTTNTLTSDEYIPRTTYVENTGLNWDNKYELKKIGGTGSPVIFIHGMSGHPVSRWLDPNKYLPYLKLNTDFFNNHSVYTYEYKWWLSLSDAGKILVEKLNETDINKNIILIGHSMGGLVARSAVHHGANINKLITLATPHEGSICGETFLKTIEKIKRDKKDGNCEGVRDLLPNSDFLKMLHNSENEKNNMHKYVMFSGIMEKKNGEWLRNYKSDGNVNLVQIKLMHNKLNKKKNIKKYKKIYNTENEPYSGWLPNDGNVPVFSQLMEITGSDEIERHYPKVEHTITEKKKLLGGKKEIYKAKPGSYINHKQFLIADEDLAQYIANYIGKL